jgi:hypothetical protein
VRITDPGSNVNFRGISGDPGGLGVHLKLVFRHDIHVSTPKCCENHESGLKFDFRGDFGGPEGLGVQFKLVFGMIHMFLH